jgi:hypothetical protein
MTERRSDADETLTRITELARRAIEAQTSVAKQSIELGRAALSSKIDPASAGRAWVEAVSREGTRYWKEVGALGLDVAGQLLTLGTRGVARVMNDTRAAVRPGAGAAHSTREGAAGPAHSTGGAGSAAGPGAGGAEAGDTSHTGDTGDTSDTRRRVAVTLRGAVGDTARATVTVANQHPRARRVLLNPSPLRDESGSVVRLPFRVDPEGVTIPAGSEHAVHLEVDLLSEAVLVGGRYRGTVDVSGGDEAVLDVTVEVVD